jgi:transcriptional regulator with XRE-family HTH domain
MKHPVQRSFGSRLAQLRRQRCLSQEELAKRCGLHRTYVSSVERGERNISLVNIVALAKILCSSASALLRGID